MFVKIGEVLERVVDVLRELFQVSTEEDTRKIQVLD